MRMTWKEVGIELPQFFASHPTTAFSSASPGGADQAYSMMSYAKTFFEDIFGFVKDLPSWGKVFLVIVLLWAFFAFKG